MRVASATTRSVRLADIFQPERIVVGLKNCTKQGAVAELIHHLVALGHLAEGDENGVVESILAREKLGSTALYDGVALPHCRSTVTERFLGVLGIEPAGIPFDAVNGELVRCVFLLLAPLERREEFYEVLGRITAIGRDKSRRTQLQGCRTADAAHRFLQELDS